MTTNQNLLTRFAPIAVVGAALTFSAWSLFYVTRSWGAPLFVAITVSMIFDGAAVWMANIALQSAIEGDSGFTARFWVFVFAGLSAWLNIQHAYIGHYPDASRPLWGAPPIIAVIVYDRYAKWQRRKTLRNTGTIPAAMPRFSGWNWLLFPVKTLKHVRAIADYRGNLTRSLATGEPFAGTLAVTGANSGLTAQLLAGTSANPADVRRWARAQGLPVGRTGPIPADATARYMQAMLTGEPVESIESPEPHFEEFQPDPIPEIGQINGHEPIQTEEIES
jgi:Protein of unknown function (DUF2637)